ncbi:MAG: hypothetical protein ACLU0O_02160 [Collinsella sp.]
MSTFKTALRMALAHPFYLLIYTVFISLMGVFIAASVSWNSSQLTEYEPYDTNVIVVDRDNSDLSRALTKHLGSRFELVTGVGDGTYDLADALSKSNSAKGSADCVFFIPEGFERPRCSRSRGRVSAQTRCDLRCRHHGGGALVCRGLALDLARGRCGARLEPAAPTAMLPRRPSMPPPKRAEVRSSRSGLTRLPPPPRSSRTSTWCVRDYLVGHRIGGIGVLGHERARARASPYGCRPGLRAPALACRVPRLPPHRLHLVCVEHDGRRGLCRRGCRVGVGRVCLALASTFELACTHLDVGFELSSLGARDEMLNGVVNLLGMLMTFLGGAWMPLSLMGSAVQTVAHFVPTYWVNDAIGKALASDLTSTVLGDIACDLGVTVLFTAAAIAAVGWPSTRQIPRLV